METYFRFFVLLTPLFSLAVAAETPKAAPTRNDGLKVLESKKVSPRTIRSSRDEATQPLTQAIQATEEPAEPQAQASFGLGVSTLGLSGAPTFSALLQHGTEHQLQMDFGIPSTNAFTLDFNFGYRFGLQSFERSGVHLGGFARINLSANAVATVDLAFSPLAGIHLGITEDKRTLLSLDAGPTLSISGGNLGFKLGALSDFLGLSIHRLF